MYGIIYFVFYFFCVVESEGDGTGVTSRERYSGLMLTWTYVFLLRCSLAWAGVQIPGLVDNVHDMFTTAHDLILISQTGKRV